MDFLEEETPYFSTNLGHAYLGDALNLLPKIPSRSVDLICTSPPFALLRQKAYGNIHSKEYVEWFLQFAKEFARILKQQGSLVIDIGGTWVKGRPIRSVYHYELMFELIKPKEEGGCGFHLVQELYWYNPAKLPTPAEWVTVRRIRLKDAVNTVWWFSLDDFPKADNRNVLKQYSESQLKLMRDGYRPRLRPSEHDISDKFGKDNNGAIPPIIINGGLDNDEEIGKPVLMSTKFDLIPTQIITASNTSSNDLYLQLCRENDVNPHPARFPRALPEFAINLCTEDSDVVLDPFAGSNMTGYVAEKLGRHWIAIEQTEEYLRGSVFRFREPNEDARSYFEEIIENGKIETSQITLGETDAGEQVQKIRAPRRFTYGDQFGPIRTPIVTLLELSIANEPDRGRLQQAIQDQYFKEQGRTSVQRDQNSKIMAMNCLLSMNSYGLIQLAKRGTYYRVTDLAHDLFSVKESLEEVHRRFALHILTKLEGLLLVRLIERMTARGEKITLEYLGDELNDLGIRLPINSTYISTMRSWLDQVGVFGPGKYEINWEVINDLLQIEKGIINELHQLTVEQKYYLLSLLSLDQRNFTPSSTVARHTRSLYKIRLTTKNLVKDILEPLEKAELIEVCKVTEGRGAKPHDVRLTQKAINEFLPSILDNLADLTDLTSSELNRTLDDVIADLNHENKSVRGAALELLTIWIIRLLGLRFAQWRYRSGDRNHMEAGVIAASDKIAYSRWQIQCKANAGRFIGIDAVAKEVGLAFLTQADVIMIVTTGSFTDEAFAFAEQVSDSSRYYVILLEIEDIKRFAKDKALIVDILNRKARRTYVKRDMGMIQADEPLEEELEEEIETEGRIERAMKRNTIQDNAVQLELFEPASKDLSEITSSGVSG